MDELKKIELEVKTIEYDLMRRSEAYSRNMSEKQLREMIRQADGCAAVVAAANLGNIDNAIDMLISDYVNDKHNEMIYEDFRRLHAWMDVLYHGVCYYNADFCAEDHGEDAGNVEKQNNNGNKKQKEDNKKENLVSCLD